MRVVSDLGQPVWAADDAGRPGRAVVTIGAYDGVHLGHRSVISAVRDHAARLGIHDAVVTFDRHPASVVRPDSAPLLITDSEQKLELLAATGVEATVVVPFDEHAAGESAESFVERVLVGVLGVRRVIVGADFHFGHGRRGNVEFLRALGEVHDFDVVPMELLAAAGGSSAPVSSTAIRAALREGDVTSAAAMLGRPFQTRGIVVRGDQRGRTIGVPTANVEVPAGMILPADGVYAGWYERPDGSRHPCAINLGRRPTFYTGAEVSLLEAHLLDFRGDLYGEPARVSFVAALRGERRFDGVDELVAQLQRDIAAARDALEHDPSAAQAG